MPTYEYHCDDCGRGHEEVRSIHKAGPEACPACSSANFRQVFGAPTVWAYGNPTTVGQQAELNARRAGKEQTEKMFAGARPERPPPPWYRDGSVPGVPKLDKPLDLSTVRDVNDYVLNGRK